MLSKDAIADVIETLRGTDFYRPAHEIVVDIITDLCAAGRRDHGRGRAEPPGRDGPDQRRAARRAIRAVSTPQAGATGAAGRRRQTPAVH
ncbi:hypothetical protein [Kribbella swartbergensis]